MILQDTSLPLAPNPGSLPDEGVASIEVRGSGDLIAGSPAMRSLLRALEQFRDAPLVLLQGETGTGKDLLARFLHDRATGRTAGFQPFLGLDPTALDSDRLADELDSLRPGSIGRTLLIREVSELPVALQHQLLKALDSVTAGSGRIVCSTQNDLEKAVGARSFLPALWERLRPVALRLPPLRERRQDLPHLICHFLQRLADQYGRPPVELTREAWQVLLTHRWEGNVRELRNEIERLVVFAPENGSVGVTGLSTVLQEESRSGPAGWVDRSRRRSSTARSDAGRWMCRASCRTVFGTFLTVGDRCAELWPGRTRRRSRGR